MIPQDKAKEYMEVAALVCLDLDTLLEISKDEKMTADELRAQIRLIHENKESAIKDKAAREDRYAACCLVFGLAAKGHIRSTPMSP
jgi:hypothetical protein